MTAIALRPAPPQHPGLETQGGAAGGRLRRTGQRMAGVLSARRSELLIITGILIVCGLAHGIGFDGYPGRINDDEGTYVAQAWAMDFRHSITHYTYTYDHPFGGWLLMAGVFLVTGALHWVPTAVTAGRLVMLLVHLVTCVLIYGVARRMNLRQVSSVIAVALFSLSPLAIFYQRMAFLDNIAVMWLLAALYCAASAKRSVGAAVCAGLCMAMAICSKETFAVMLPAVYWMLRQHFDGRNRRLAAPGFWGAMIGLVSIYPFYAFAKGELVPGEGHVSLLGTLKFQVWDRPSSGSVLHDGSGAHGLVMQWIHLDPILAVVGPIAAVVALWIPRLRPVALGLLLQVLLLLRGGYLPFAFVTAMLPFAALVLAGIFDSVAVSSRLRRAASVTTWAAGLALLAVSALLWAPDLKHAMVTNDSRGSANATRWFLANEPRDAVVLTDDNIWTDLVIAGQHPDPVWLFKLDLDPAVRDRIGGWRGIDYVILGPVSRSDAETLPTVMQAIDHSVIIKTFTNGYTVRKVVK